MAGIIIQSNNFNGQSVQITFSPFSGGSINLGTQTIPYTYTTTNYEGDYSIYIPSSDKTCSLQVGTPPSPTPTSTITPTPTLTPTNTPTPTPSGISIDPDASAYLADIVISGGTITPTIESAVDTLFSSLKSAGLYDKIYTMYPFVGGVAASHAINAKLNKSFDITWYGGMTHDISGSTGNGSNGYGDTGFNPYIEIGSTAGIPSHSSLYVGTSLGNQTYSEFGARDANHDWIMAIAFQGNYYGWQYHTGEIYFANSNHLANYIQTRTSTTNLVLYKNGVSFSTLSNTEGRRPPNKNLRVFGDGVLYSARRLQFTTIGEALNPTEASTLDNIINTFQTSLGRNVY